MEPTFPGLTGKQLCRLMRRHGVTIRELARRMGNTQKQIRHRREHGIPNVTTLVKKFTGLKLNSFIETTVLIDDIDHHRSIIFE